MRLFLSIISILVITKLSAQDFEQSMTVTSPDLSTNVYAKDSTAKALIIYDYGNAYFNKDTWMLNVEVKQKIKILTNDGLSRGQYTISLYENKGSKETIKNIRATTYNNEDGKVVKSTMDESAIFEEKNGNYSVVKLVFPNVKVGSVITFSYTKATKFINKFQPWYFQQDIPVLYSEYNTSIPGNYEYHIKMVGSLPLFDKFTDITYDCLETGGGASADCAISKYVMKNIPAYIDESYTTTSKNYISRLEYELRVIRGFDGSIDDISKTWKDVDKEFKSDSNFGKQLSKKSNANDILPSSITGMSNSLEKAKAIYRFVVDNYNWNGSSGRYDASVKRLIDDNSGNAFELNLFLENLLTSEGFEVYPMLTSTRDNGFITKIYPVITDFNYLILKIEIDDESYLLDATSQYLYFGEVPFYCLNQYGRVFDFKNSSYWYDISVKNHSTVQIRTQLSLNDDLKLFGTVRKNKTGYYANSQKKQYFENPESNLEQLKNTVRQATISKHNVLTKISDPEFTEELEVMLEEAFIGDKIYLNPFIFKFYDENPFKLNERSYPIDFGYKQMLDFSLEIDLSNKLKVAELPENQSFALPNKSGLVMFSAVSNGDKISLFIRIKIDKPYFGSEYYDALKFFMSKIVELQNNTVIVLETK